MAEEEEAEEEAVEAALEPLIIVVMVQSIKVADSPVLVGVILVALMGVLTKRLHGSNIYGRQSVWQPLFATLDSKSASSRPSSLVPMDDFRTPTLAC